MAAISLNDTITIALSVSDRHASAKWYGDLLGFELLFHADDAGWSELKTFSPGVTLGLGEQVEVSPGNAIPVFGLEDIDTARRTMEGMDIRFDGDTVEIPGMVKLATFYDPDGNALMLAQNLMQGDG